MEKEKKRGGSRPGSGRKPIENKRVQITGIVDCETRDTIKDYCKERKTRFGRVLDEMVKDGVFDKED